MPKSWHLSGNILLLYLVKASGLLLPLAILPYLTRALGPEEFGRFAIAQSLALLLSVLIEFGFILSATREASVFREHSDKLAQLTSNVHCAKLVLSCAALLIALGAIRIVDAGELGYIGGAWLYALAVGLSPAWYYQGIEEIRLFSALDILAKMFSVSLVFFFVDRHDGYLVLYFLAIGPLVATTASIINLYTRVEFRAPSVRSAILGLRSGASMFLFRAAISAYTVANVLVLGLFVAPGQVAYFAGAEKLVRGAAGLIGPVSQAVFPRVSRLVQEDRAAGIRLVQGTLAAMLLASVAGSIIVYLYTTKIAAIFLGPGYEPAGTVIQSIVWIIPLIAVGNVLGIQWMLPLRMEREFNFIVIFAGLINLTLGVLLSHRLGISGIVIATLVAEAVVVALIVLTLGLKKALPL